MKVRKWSEYPWYTWLISSALAYWTYTYATEFTLLHEWGHLVFGFGGVCNDSAATVNVGWIGADIGGSIFPILVFAAAGRLSRKVFPPVWALGGMFAWLVYAIEYAFSLWGDYSDFPALKIDVVLAIFAICLYDVLKPSTKGLIWRHLEPWVMQSWQEARGSYGTTHLQDSRGNERVGRSRPRGLEHN